MNPVKVDVLIIGAGVVGAAIARELSRYELKTMLIEKEADVSFGTSKANSGIVHSGIHDRQGTLKARLCVAGNRIFPALAAELDLLYKNNGTLIVAQHPSELPLLEKLRANGIANGVSTIKTLIVDELLKLEPNLSNELAGGLLVPSGGIVATYDLVFALVENAVANGVNLQLQTEVTAIHVMPDHFRAETNRGIIQTKYLINAAGIDSGKIARLIGDQSFTITPRKGEEYLLDRRLEGLVQRTIFPLPSQDTKGILVIPTVGGNIMIGPTAQNIESFSDHSTSATGWNEVYQEVSRLVPKLHPHDLITSFAGLRAISNQDDFIIGPSAISPRFFHAAGIKSPGLTAAPAIAQYLLELMKDQGLPLVPNAGFNPLRRVIRLHQMDLEEQVVCMDKNPAYANIICRCELVSEAEIRAAVRRGATTVDGVKLRTRAGMGRCQGGFCTIRVIQIISEELGMSPEQITKNGPGSSILLSRLRSAKEGDGPCK